MAEAIRFGFMGRHDDGGAFARVAEEVGADALAWGESPSQFPDPYVGMTLTAQATSRVMMGTVVTCPGLRHPAVLANTLQELQRVSNGRMFCGIGTGDLALIEMGERPYKMDDFVAYASAARRLAAGEEVEWNGHPLRMRTAPVKPVPFWFGADGPRGIEAAGQVADGIVVAQVGGPDVVRTVTARAKASAEQAGRSLDDLAIWFMLRVVLTDKDDGAIDLDGLDEYATRALRFLWRTAGKPSRDGFAAALLAKRGLEIDPDIAGRLHDFNQRWDEARAFNSKYHVGVMDELGLREFAGRYFFISGSPDRIALGVQTLIDAGARNFFTPFLVGDRIDSARRIAAILNELR